MYINKYLLITLGLVIAIVLALLQHILFMMLWSLIFWSWYFSKPTIKKDDKDV